MAKPSIAIFVHAGDLLPSMFSTACSEREDRALCDWLAAHPELGELVSTARDLAERGAGDEARHQELEPVGSILPRALEEIAEQAADELTQARLRKLARDLEADRAEPDEAA